MIKGQIPEFSHEDVQLSWYIGNVKQTEPFPKKNDGYVGTSVTCEKGASAEWSNAIWGLVNINSSNNKKVYCSVTFESGNTIADNDVKNSNVKCNATVFGVKGTSGCVSIDNMQVGDLVSYTPPTGSEGNVLAAWTGCSADLTACNGQSAQTFHPEYNKLWRVIKKNADGTIDMISEYTSFDNVFFYGLEGYQVLVDGLQSVVNLYKNDTYILNARSIGYNNQTGSLSNTSIVITAANNHSLAPWGPWTNDNSNEVEGGGDILYQADTGVTNGKYNTEYDYGSEEGLIYNVYKNYRGSEPKPLLAYKTKEDGTNSNEAVRYYLSSRAYATNGESDWFLDCRNIKEDGGLSGIVLYSSSYGKFTPNLPVRPILTLKSDLLVGGTGTIDDPWQVN